jgi:heme/copper-type cytochrome/quinol oxidase subunit 2
LAPSEQTAPRSAGAAAYRAIRGALALAALSLVLIAEPAQALQLAPEAPHSPNTEDMATAYWVMLAVIVLIALAINGALIAALMRFRARRGRAPVSITAGRGAIGRLGAGLGVLALAIFVFGVVISERARSVDDSGPEGLTASTARAAQVPVSGVTESQLEAADAVTSSEETGVFKPAEGDPLVIDAIAQQWLWRFEYPGGTPGQRTFSYGELVVPVDTAVVLEIDSIDVISSWWVPALTGQVQAVPGDIAQTWFKADEVGVYEGQGTIFNGTAYPSLAAQVRVVEPAEYEAYVEGLTADLTEAQEAVAQATEQEAAAQEATEDRTGGAQPAQDEAAGSSQPGQAEGGGSE